MPSHVALLHSLYARGHRGVDLGLDRVLAASRALREPHRGLTVLHVAGTNGKGSTCAMLDAIVRQAGLRSGLYTSPHLARLTERIRVDGEEVPEERFDRALERVLRDAPADLTFFFETMTLTAFLVLKEVQVDVAILEVGLGGRLDATNIVERPLVTGITSITSGEDGKGLEHAALLGSTVSAIAAEKAGIAKQGVPLVLGELADEARDAIVQVAQARGADPICVAAQVLDGWELSPALLGPHQRANASVAAAMALFAQRALPLRREHIEQGIAAARWPGRLERMEVEQRNVILDCAHNVEGARALAQALDATLDPSRTTLLFGALADKSWSGMLRTLAPLASNRIYTLPSGRAPAGLDALQAIAPGLTEPDPLRAADLAIQRTSAGDTLLVAGSIYLVGAVRAHWLGLTPDPVIAL